MSVEGGFQATEAVVEEMAWDDGKVFCQKHMRRHRPPEC
jgi:hypothetical protein